MVNPLKLEDLIKEQLEAGFVCYAVSRIDAQCEAAGVKLTPTLRHQLVSRLMTLIDEDIAKVVSERRCFEGHVREFYGKPEKCKATKVAKIKATGKK